MQNMGFQNNFFNIKIYYSIIFFKNQYEKMGRIDQF